MSTKRSVLLIGEENPCVRGFVEAFKAHNVENVVVSCVLPTEPATINGHGAVVFTLPDSCREAYNFKKQYRGLLVCVAATADEKKGMKDMEGIIFIDTAKQSPHANAGRIVEQMAERR